MLRACIICKDEYYGDSWGVTFTNTSHDFENPTFPDKIVVCFYCHAGNKERQWKPEWETKTTEKLVGMCNQCGKDHLCLD